MPLARLGFLTFIIATLVSFSLNAKASQEEEIPKILAEIDVQSTTIGGKQLLAISFKNHPHWHTYWKNPGDAGLPINNQFFQNDEEVKLEDLPWPIPHRFIENGNLWAFGYEGEYTLFYSLDGLKDGPLDIKSNWLICKHICIPGNIDIKGEVSGGTYVMKSSSHPEVMKLQVSKGSLSSRHSALPDKVGSVQDLEVVLTANEKKDGFILYYTLSQNAQKSLGPGLNLLVPYRNAMFTWGHEELFQDRKGNLYGRVEAEWNGLYEEPEIPFPTDGKFDKPYTLEFLVNLPGSSRASIFSKTFTELNSGARERLENLIGMLTRVELNQNKIPTATTVTTEGTREKQAPSSFFYYLLMAFLGGLILNIMPCVLPVISIKLFGLVKNRDSSNTVVLKHNIAYTLGILFSFLVLGGAILILKSAGQTIGWGFQLQSPKFVALMILVLFIFTLNLYGLFEFQTPGGSVFGNMSTKEGFVGDFLSGILAVVLSTPCSAPFLGTALTFAFTSEWFVIMAVLQAVGLGLATPFIITGIFPKSVAFLPKPGKWMEDVKKFLGLTLILTTIWLLDVFQALTDGTLPTIKLNTLLALTFFAFYFRKNIAKNLILNWGIVIFPLFFLINIMTSPLTDPTRAEMSDMVVDKRTAEGLNWQPWSEDRMLEMAKNEELVFIDFTAKWCFTCKVNEKLVLDTRGFKDLVKKRNIQLLLGDWTKRDPKIGNWLKSQGMVGVPAYFIQKKDGTLMNLGETITIEKISKNLE